MDLHELVRRNDLVSLRSALAQGVAPDPRDDTGETPLILAAGQGFDEAVDTLLDAGADIGIANDFGFDALGSALWCNHLALARRLVARGAVVSISDAAALDHRNVHGLTASDLARSNGFDELADALQEGRGS